MKTVPWPHLGPHDTDVMPFSMVERDHVHANKIQESGPLAAARYLCRMIPQTEQYHHFAYHNIFSSVTYNTSCYFNTRSI